MINKAKAIAEMRAVLEEETHYFELLKSKLRTPEGDTQDRRAEYESQLVRVQALTYAANAVLLT